MGKRQDAVSLTYPDTAQHFPDSFTQYQNCSTRPINTNDLEKFRKNEGSKNICSSCRKNEICVYYLKNSCRDTSCGKQHTEEPFQWQILPKSGSKKVVNGYHKNENGGLSAADRRWINVEKNENIKLELAY